jgi:LPXTG-site transpeptidase (sortase) family protein
MRTFEGLLLLTGVFLLSIYAGWWTGATLFQAREQARFERELAGQRDQRDQMRFPPPPAPGLELKGKVEIERLGLAAMIEEGADDAILNRAVGHIPGTSVPWKGGNVALAAHRDTFFRGLDRLEPGDRIRLTTLEGSFDYVVDSTQVVEPSATEVLQNTGEPVLTLVTCFPFRYVGRAPMRYIVRARRSGETGSRESHTRPERPAARGSLQAPAGANPTLPAGSRGSGSEAPPPLRGGRSRGVWLPDPLNPRPDPSA